MSALDVVSWANGPDTSTGQTQNASENVGISWALAYQNAEQLHLSLRTPRASAVDCVDGMRHCTAETTLCARVNNQPQLDLREPEMSAKLNTEILKNRYDLEALIDTTNQWIVDTWLEV